MITVALISFIICISVILVFLFYYCRLYQLLIVFYFSVFILFLECFCNFVVIFM